ncbi:MAG: 4-hydroxy-3-methylbut-2-enyl diphosphate reductase [Candidatus Aureabacteria bacterium]|nr:4-hydroxy-3-methylbut-2-enyl diphosphate reductase [Candidatus Auribacterota bacterium]
MKIIVAKNAGFCMGVKRALEMVLDRSARDRTEIVTYGPLIHNPQVVDLLARKGIRSSRDFSDFRPGRIGFISAHGISPAVRGMLKAGGAAVCDASCPDVVKVQGIIRRCAGEGMSTVIFGDRGHSEVEGLLGFTEGRGHVVGSPAEAESLPPLDRVCLVSQTTQNEEEFAVIAEALRRRAKEVRVFPTICPSTRSRQADLHGLLSRIDALVVVGGKNSANTARLARIASLRGIPAFRVETADDLPMDEIGKFDAVGVTAGASTPNWLIQGVVDRLRDWSWRRRPAPLRWAHGALTIVVKSNLFIALGAAALTLAAQTLMGIPADALPILLSFSAVLGIYNLNILADQAAILLNQPSRYLFFRSHRSPILLVSVASLLLAFLIGARLGTLPLLLVLFTLLLGLSYSFRILPRPFPRRRLKDIPGSKEIFSSLGWGTLTVLIPLYSCADPLRYPFAPLVAFAFVFIIMFVRSTLLDIRDMQGDRLVGRETIPVIIGKEKTKVLIAAANIFLAALVTVATARKWAPPSGYLFLPVIAYGFLYLYLYHRRVLFQDLIHEVVVDGKLLLAGVMALLA